MDTARLQDLNIVMPMHNLLEQQKQQVAYGIISEMNQVIPFLLILNLLNTRQVLQEILIMLVMVKMIMMQTKLVKIYDSEKCRK